MKVEFNAHWDGEALTIIDEDFLLEQLRSNFQPGYLDGIVQHPFEWKSSEQFGYLFGEVMAKAVMGLRDAGYEFSDKYAALKFLMKHPDIDCTDKVIGPFGDIVDFSAKSLASMSRREVYELTQKLCQLVREMFYIDVADPEDYKILMSVKKSRK